MEGAPRPPLSKADYVYSTLREEILGSRLPGGSVVRQDEIARRLGVSITPVREALRRLENDRLISYEAHRGATVVELGSGAVRELYRLRAVVEGLAARLAAERITDDELAGLRDLHEQMVADHAAGRLAELGAASERLHLAIADIGGPDFIGGHTRWIRSNHPVPSTASLWLDGAQAATFLQAHDRLLRALADGDGAAAERAMIEHIEYGADRRLGGPSRPHP